MNPVHLVVEWVLPTLATLAILLWSRRPEDAGRATSLLWRWRWPLLVGLRLLWPAAIFWFLGERVESDLSWRGQRSGWFLEGQTPGVDYANNHAPLVPYLEGVGRWLIPTNPRVGSLLFFTIGDILAVLFGWRLAERLQSGLRDWAAAWLLLSPALWHQAGIRGQDESLFAAAIVAAIYFALERRDLLCGTALAIGVCATKPTFLPYAATLMLAMGWRRWKIGASMFVVMAAVYAAYASTGAPVGLDHMVARHGSNYGAGFSIIDTLQRFGVPIPKTAAILTYVAVTGAVMFAAPWLHRSAGVEQRAVRAVVAVHAASMLTMPFCVSPYFSQGITVMLAFAVLLRGRERTLYLWALPLLGWLICMHWTKAPIFTMPMKPSMILFHSCLLLVALRPEAGEEPSGETAVDAHAPAM